MGELSGSAATHTGKNTQVVASLTKSCDRLVVNKSISGCVLITCESLWTSLKSFASCQQTCCKLIVKPCYPQASCKLFQQVVTSLKMTFCHKNCSITSSSKVFGLNILLNELFAT